MTGVLAGRWPARDAVGSCADRLGSPGGRFRLPPGFCTLRSCYLSSPDADTARAASIVAVTEDFAGPRRSEPSALHAPWCVHDC